MKFGSVMAVGTALLILGSAAASPAMADLASHRAIYKMRLASTKASSGVSAASGAMSYEFADTCEGWTVENKTVLNFAYNEGGEVVTTWDFVTWESKDGLRYRFKVRSTRDGAVVEEIDGTATLDGVGKGGVARFTMPEDMTIDLPPGTFFPTHHTLELVERARADKRMFGGTVFDGSGTDGPFEVSAAIGRMVAPAVKSAQPLTDTPSWRVRMAFFPVASREAEPDYEVDLRYFDNGVAKDVTQDFGDFSLKAKLDRIEPLPKPDC